MYECIPFTRKQVIFLLPKCVKRPLKYYLACYDALKLKLSSIQAGDPQIIYGGTYYAKKLPGKFWKIR